MKQPINEIKRMQELAGITEATKSNPEGDKLLKVINTKKAGPEYKKALMDLIAMAEKKSGKTINTKKEALLALDYIEPSINEAGKALDKVGKEDSDIDNDGDTDKTDKYLQAKRDAISKNINEENIPYPLASLYNLVEKLVAQGITKDEILRIVDFATVSSNLKEGDHEVGMAQNLLDDIIKNAAELKLKVGAEEKNLAGWIQDHISQSQNFINQANTGFHD